jgi:hypothetical protein
MLGLIEQPSRIVVRFGELSHWEDDNFAASLSRARRPCLVPLSGWRKHCRSGSLPFMQHGNHSLQHFSYIWWPVLF